MWYLPQKGVRIFYGWLANSSIPALLEREVSKSPPAGSLQTLAPVPTECWHLTSADWAEGNFLQHFTQSCLGNARGEFKEYWLEACVSTAESCAGSRVTLRRPRSRKCFSKAQISFPKALPALPTLLQPNKKEDITFSMVSLLVQLILTTTN